MSVKDSPVGDPGPVAAQAEAVLREAHALQAALNRAKATRRLLLLVVVIFVVLASGAFYRLYARVSSDKYLESIRDTASQRLEKNTDRYTREVRVLVENVRSPVEKVFMEEFKKDSPAYMKKMQDESDVFAQNLQEQLAGKLDDFHTKAIENNLTIVENEFPSVQDPRVQQRLVDNMHIAIEDLAQKYYVDEMRKTFADLYKAWGEIPPAPEPKGDVASVEDQFLGTLLDFLSMRLTQPPPA